MGSQMEFSSTLIEYISEAVALQRELEQNDPGSVVRTQCDPRLEVLSRDLGTQLINLTDFDLECWNTADSDQQEWINWAKAAMSWVGELRKVCRAVQLKAKALLEKDPSLAVGFELHLNTPSSEPSNLHASKETMLGQTGREQRRSLRTSADMGVALEILRERARNVRERFEELKGIKKMTKTLLVDRTVIGPKNSPLPLKGEIEEGEITETAEEIRTAHWAEFGYFRSRVTHFASSLESTQKAQLDCIRKLGQEIATAKPPLPTLNIVPEELDQVISSLVERWLSPGKERLFVQIEDELLKFKADYFCHLLDSLKPLLDEAERREKEA